MPVTIASLCSALANHSKAMANTADYSIGFYNGEQLHYKLGTLAPNALARVSATQQPVDMSKIT